MGREGQRFCRKCGHQLGDDTDPSGEIRPAIRPVSRLLIALIVVLFLVLGALAAILVNDIRDESPDRAPTPTQPAESASGTRPITSTD